MNSLNGGYAMIKYNSTQEELQIAYRSKKPVLCYDENRRAHWAVIEETVTESVDEETREPITIYEYSYRLIDEASGGGSLYRHQIHFEIGASAIGDIVIFNNSASSFTNTSLIEYLSNYSSDNYYLSHGLFYANDTCYSILGVFKYSDTSYPFGIKYSNLVTSQTSGFAPTSINLTDTITEV